jgi:hypothetical protein
MLTYVLAAGQARSHPGTSPVIKAGAADTGGLFTFAEEVLGPRTPAGPLHVHHQEDEFPYVIDGHLLVQVGEKRTTWARAASRGCPCRSSTPSPMSAITRRTSSGP